GGFTRNIKNLPHPEEAAKWASRRTHRRPSGAGEGAVFLPEAADRCLAGAEGLRFSVVPAHHHDAAVVVVVLQRALHKAADAAVFERDIAGGADQIALAQPALGHRLVIALEAEMHPFELGPLDPAPADDAHR